MLPVTEPPTPASRKTAAEPLRRKRTGPEPAVPGRRKPLQLLLVFVTTVLLIDALVGERGLVERMRAGQQYREAQTALEGLRQENARLLEEARQLRDDSYTIEALARRDLGLLRPGEVLFIIKDAKPPQ